MLWKNDKEMFELAKKEMFVALVGDILDKMGYTKQFLSPHLKPLYPTMVTIGRAMPVLEADVFSEVMEQSRNPIMQKPFGLLFEALDSLKEDEVYICSGASPNYALWGGLMSTRAIKLGAAGAVLDGYSRDTNEILELSFPTFSIYRRSPWPVGYGPKRSTSSIHLLLTSGVQYIHLKLQALLNATSTYLGLKSSLQSEFLICSINGNHQLSEDLNILSENILELSSTPQQ